MELSDLNGDNLKEHLPSYLLYIYPCGRAIYLICVGLIIISLAVLPLVSVQVSVSGRGIIRPVQEKTRILAAASGIVSEVYIKEGDRIRKSEPLLQIRSIETRKNLHTLHTELKETEAHVLDLEGLTSSPLISPLSARYTKEYEEFKKEREYLELLQSKAKRELLRHERLYRGGLISEKDYDDLVFEFDKTTKELENHKYRSLNKWQNEYYNQLVGLRDLEMQIRNAEEEVLQTTILAPASGNMVEFDGICEGSVVQAGNVIGILSPESVLIGEFYIPSRNIAYLRQGQKVQLHLDAFSTREWGFIPAHIYDISSDFILLDNQPVYRVKCRLERTEMNLKNGYTACLKKGMTFYARCLVSRRTLFQLLADKADNWLNPAIPVGETNPLP